MRARMRMFPGGDWPLLADPEDPSVYENASRFHDSQTWWKWRALHTYARNTPLAGLVWCDDHLASHDSQTHQLVQEALTKLGIPHLLVSPHTNVGLTPADLVMIKDWVTNAGMGSNPSE